MAIFCWHWDGSILPDSSPSARETSLTLHPRTGRPQETSWRTAVKPVANPVFSALNGHDPFAGRVETLLTAGDNPFAVALAAGVSEGTLIVKGRIGGVPVYGPNLRGAARYTDQDILRELRASAGGNFGNFLKNVFGKHEQEGLAASQEADENPFRRSESEAAAKKAETPAAETKPEKPADASADKPEPQDKPAELKPQKALPAGTYPDLLLRIGEKGTLEAVPAGHPAEGIPTNSPSQGTYRVSDRGDVEFNVFPFADPADFPMSMAVADVNNDGIPDIVIHSSLSGMLHFFTGSADGSYTETMRVQAGKQQLSLVAGDFNQDGIADLAMSNAGTGAVTVLFGSASSSYNFRSFWADPYRDFITATDTTGTGIPDVVGLDFANRASILLDFVKQSSGATSGRSFDYLPAFASQIAAAAGRSARLNAVLLGSNLSINVDSAFGQLTNVMSVAPGLNVSIIVGNLNNSGSLVFGVATPRKK